MILLTTSKAASGEAKLGYISRRQHTLYNSMKGISKTHSRTNERGAFVGKAKASLLSGPVCTDHSCGHCINLSFSFNHNFRALSIVLNLRCAPTANACPRSRPNITPMYLPRSPFENHDRTGPVAVSVLWCSGWRQQQPPCISKAWALAVPWPKTTEDRLQKNQAIERYSRTGIIVACIKLPEVFALRL